MHRIADRVRTSSVVLLLSVAAGGMTAATAMAQQVVTVGNVDVVIAPTAPPPLETEIIPAAPAQTMAWEAGHWMWNGAAWQWAPGQYVVRPQPTANWEPGHWAAQPTGGYAWVDGHWD